MFLGGWGGGVNKIRFRSHVQSLDLIVVTFPIIHCPLVLVSVKWCAKAKKLGRTNVLVSLFIDDPIIRISYNAIWR